MMIARKPVGVALFLYAFSLFFHPIESAVAGEMKENIRYKSTPEGDLHLDLYYPSGDAPGPYPVVIYTHGGGWVTGNKELARKALFGRVTKGLNANGFCVAAVQYRLWSKGQNIAIRDCVTDAKDAVRYLVKNREELQLDTERVFVFGDSAGGQLAQVLLLSPPNSFPGDLDLENADYTMIAGVSWYGPSDFQDPQLFNHDDRPDFRDRFGPRIMRPTDGEDEMEKLYREVSPISYLSAESPPLLLIQGDGDETIPVKQAYHMEKRAGELQAPVETMIVKGAGHNWRQAQKGIEIEPGLNEIVKRTVDFIVAHIK